MDTLLSLAMILGIVLVLAANIAVVMGAYCFVEGAFAEHYLWGLGIVLPPVAGIALWIGGWGLAVVLNAPALALLGFIAGFGLACMSPIVCLVVAVLRWRQVGGYLGVVVGAAVFLVAWVILMAYVGPGTAAG